MTITMNDSLLKFVAERVGPLSAKNVQAVLEMNEEGSTVPFMARYRKERTGNLDEVQIRGIVDAYGQWNEYTSRLTFILKEIEKQGNLTAELKARIQAAKDLAELEEIYRPFKRKKKTKATLAREAGLQPLADWLWELGHGKTGDVSPEVKAKEFTNAAAGYVTYDECLRGAQHIIVEKLSNLPELRAQVRQEFYDHGKLRAQKTTGFKPHSKYEMYADYQEAIKSLLSPRSSHRYLAVRRGWQEDELKVTIEADEAKLLQIFEREAFVNGDPAAEGFLKSSAEMALKVHVIPSITNEIHADLKQLADQAAIKVFADNVRRVLLASPFGAKVVLGVDPGLRTGCKVALVDRTSNYISHTVVHIQTDAEKEKAKALFAEVFKQMKIEAIAVGNGTGGRETEKFFRSLVKELGATTPVIMVNEAGASVYSASEIAREEFPDLDVTVRGAISIARRLQDPLAELVKIEPKSIGVGQYQHDVAQGPLKKSLTEEVESCVNLVGVDLNTASASLLQYVSGIGPAIAKNIVGYRKEKGGFTERAELLKVPQFSAKVFEQSAGFLRVMGGKLALDATGIHPERYSAVRDMAQELGLQIGQLIGSGAENLLKIRDKWVQLVGEFTFNDIVKELEKPGRDPRDPFKVFEFREDINEVKDLKPGMICPGIVSNVTNFGAFVDIGVHQDGLVHISELGYQFVDDPRKVVNPGQQVQVRVLAVDLEKKQISLSMRLEERPAPQRMPERENRNRPERPRKAQEGGKPRPRPPEKAVAKAPEPKEKPIPKPSAEKRPGESSLAAARRFRNELAMQARMQQKPARPKIAKAPEATTPAKPERPASPRSGGEQRKPSVKTPFNNPFAALVRAGKDE